MSEEGEFKKRLWNWLTETACPKYDSDFLDLARFEAENDFTKIIEDAKKEFLFFFVAYSEDMSPETKKELEKLIKKWFGKAKEVIE